MRVSENDENEDHSRQIPPLCVERIAGEILAGTALGYIALAVVNAIAIIVCGDWGEYKVLGTVVVFLFAFPPLNGFGIAVGVYLVGSRGKQTGSFFGTLVGSFLLSVACFLPLLMLLRSVGPHEVNPPTAGEKIVQLGGIALVLLIPPIVATLAFNSTRRYKLQCDKC